MSNSFSHLRAISLLACALLLTAGTAASAGPTKEGAPPKGAPYNLAVDIDAPGAVRASLEVQIPDVKGVLRYELNARDGGLNGGIYIPPGKERRVITAFDERGEPIYPGAGYAAVDEKLTRQITIKPVGKETKESPRREFATYRLEIGFGHNEAMATSSRRPCSTPTATAFRSIPTTSSGSCRIRFELLPYSCFQDSLCIDLPDPKYSREIIACCRAMSSASPNPRTMRGPYQYVSAGSNHTCALTRSNEIRCWGDNGHGQLGAPTRRVLPR